MLIRATRWLDQPGSVSPLIKDRRGHKHRKLVFARPNASGRAYVPVSEPAAPARDPAAALCGFTTRLALDRELDPDAGISYNVLVEV
jgi:hypothetical protein